MADGQLESISMVTIELCSNDTQPSQTCSEGYTISATVFYRGVSLFLGGINKTKTYFGIPVALEAFMASKEAPVRRPTPPGIRPFLEN